VEASASNSNTAVATVELCGFADASLAIPQSHVQQNARHKTKCNEQCDEENKV